MLVIRVATQSRLYRILEAKTMLERAVVVLKADKDRVLGLFTSGNGGLIDRAFYVFWGVRMECWSTQVSQA